MITIEGGDSMEIYSYGNDTLLAIIYATMAIIFVTALFFVLKCLIEQIVSYKTSSMQFPIQLTILFICFIVIPLIGFLGFGRMFIQTVSYNYNMKNGDALYLVGDVEVLSCESVDYRGDFVGYTVELSVDGEIIAPSNTFSEDVVAYFNSNEELIIQYGIIEGDGIYVWSIKTSAN
jgi:hypothetical protein